MFRSLFGRKRRPPAPSQSLSSSDSIREARVGDVMVVRGLSLEYDDTYFLIEQSHRYESPAGEWHELVAAEGDQKIWLEWSDGEELFITASASREPVGLSNIGLSEDNLIQLDEENSIDNHIDVEEKRYRYRNSSQALYFKDNRGSGEGFYVWDFVAEDEQEVLSITKWEGVPFEAYFSVVISPDNVTLYKGERPEQPRA